VFFKAGDRLHYFRVLSPLRESYMLDIRNLCSGLAGRLFGLSLASTALLACESSSTSSGSTDAATAGGDSDVAASTDATSTDDVTEGTEDDDVAETPEGDVAEADTATVNPDGPPTPKAYSGGTCPTFKAGKQSFMSSDLDREIVVTLPEDPSGAGVLFLWHGFGDTHSNFSSALGAKSISGSENLITVAPQAVIDPVSSAKLAPYKDLAAQFIGPLPPTWSVLDGPEPDIILFDDLLSCLTVQYDVDLKRVYTLGFSQGALFSTRLVLLRSDVLAGAALWSGGLGSTGGLLEVVRFEYESPKRKVPVLAVAGGAADLWPNEMLALVNFQTGTTELADALRADGHAVVECNHGLGHTIPADGLQWGLPFLFSHEWTADGASSYFGAEGGDFPKYCTMPAAQ
jgi:predicted esterase